MHDSTAFSGLEGITGQDACSALSRLLSRPLRIADVGCRWGLAEVWEVYGPKAEIVGFDPDPDECRRLEYDYAGRCDVRFVPVALAGRQGRATLHRTFEPACSSLYPPDPAAIRRHAGLEDLIRPLGSCPIAVTTLDRWVRRAKAAPFDALKLDTQGSELDILRGAIRQLRSIRILEIEVEFNPIYRGQPLFGDVDRYLRRRGFVLWRLGNLVHYGLRDASPDFAVEDRAYFDSTPTEIAARGGMISWGHAFYVHSDMVDGGSARDWESRVRDACLATAWGFRDLARRALDLALRNAPPHGAEEIRDALTT